MSNSMEQKLSKIFSESFQIKRLTKQISDLKQLREKGSYDIKMTLLKNQSLNFKIEVRPSAYKNTKLPQNLTKLIQDVKIVVKDNYPAHPPKIYFMNDNMTKFGLKPFRDYCMEVLGDSDWSAKYTIMQLIKNIPEFLQKCHNNPSLIDSNKDPSWAEHFEIDNLYSWKFCQIHPVKLSKRTMAKQGFIYIDIAASEIIILEDVGMQTTYMTCDFIHGQQIQNLYRRKNTSNKFLLELKLNYPGLNGKYGIEFAAQDSEALIMAIMDCARISQNTKKDQSQKKIKESSSQEQAQEFQIQENGNQPKGKIRDSVGYKEEVVSIHQIIQGIVVYQSLVDNKMTTQNISQLVSLLQKAIQYYSAQSDQRFTIYLNKLQSILSNQMAQALLQSANQEKKKITKSKQNIIQKQEYTSIIDLL